MIFLPQASKFSGGWQWFQTRPQVLYDVSFVPGASVAVGYFDGLTTSIRLTGVGKA